MLRFTFLTSILALILTSCSHNDKGEAHHHHDHDAATASNGKLKVLCFSRTGWYRHPETPAINRWLVLFGDKHNMEIDVSEDGKDLRPKQLAQYDVLLLNNTNELDMVLKPEEMKSVENWYASGKGIVALHAALVRQTRWKWLSELGGCDFDSDSAYLPAKVTVDPVARNHPTMRNLPTEFTYTADWTNHTKSVTGIPGIQVLLRVDESTYEPVRPYFAKRNGKAMGADHPIAWTNVNGGGRFFYTEFGHDVRSLETKFGREHLLQGILWAAGKTK